MKVIAINSSKRKANTYRILTQIEQILNRQGIQMEILNLYDYQIKNCVGCEHCLIKGKCHIQDDVPELLEKLIHCDGIILSSPVYLQAVSGILKTFVDRTCAWFHRPILYGKPILAVATTKGSGLKDTLQYIEKIGIQWGMLPSGMIGRTIVNIQQEVTEKECQKFIRNLKASQTLHNPPLKSVINFNVQKVLANQLGGLDKQYWMEQNWHNNKFYYDCKVNLGKRILGGSLYRFLNFVMSKASTNGSV